MATQEKIQQMRITLTLLALCLPLFAHHYVKAENSCPYETYIRVEQKCVDISDQGLTSIKEELPSKAIQEVNQEIKEVSQNLEDLGEELKEYCLEEVPQTSTQAEIMANICQY